MVGISHVMTSTVGTAFDEMSGREDDLVVIRRRERPLRVVVRTADSGMRHVALEPLRLNPLSKPLELLHAPNTPAQSANAPPNARNRFIERRT